MRIQSTNQNQNIAHKAYFKKNEAFMTLYKKANKTKELATFAKDLKTLTPNHEIEITNIFPTACEVCNNATQKIKKILIPNDNRDLISIISFLCLFRDSDFFKVCTDDKDVDCFDILTKKD